jgi:disabled homolog 2
MCSFQLDRNEPARFFGDGVIFKAKLIGILEVGEARGDRMCQEALQDLKMAIRAAGEHKQRITIHVTIEGLRLRDEKTGVSKESMNECLLRYLFYTFFNVLQNLSI